MKEPTQRQKRALVIIDRVPKVVLRQCRMAKCWFYVGHKFKIGDDYFRNVHLGRPVSLHQHFQTSDRKQQLYTLCKQTRCRNYFSSIGRLVWALDTLGIRVPRRDSRINRLSRPKTVCRLFFGFSQPLFWDSVLNCSALGNNPTIIRKSSDKPFRHLVYCLREKTSPRSFRASSWIFL